ncbi:MAG: serine hydrolase domain-containing protein [Candidatus Nanopelagicales bacterium]
MRTFKILIAILTTTTVFVGVPSAQAVQTAQQRKQLTFAKTIKEGRKAVRKALKETKTTSASVALVSNGKTVWSQTFGRVNQAGRKPSPTAKYGVGSVAKVVTTIAVMQLVDQGKISLDAPITRYVPDFSMASPQYQQITVRMLLNHSAGLPGSDYANGLSTKPIPSYVSGVMAGLRNSHLKTTPGAMNVYCNDCFTLAGVVVERVSGVPLQEYAARNIFTPLGMRHSAYADSVPAPGEFAPVIQGGKPEPFDVINVLAAGGLLSTSDDMARLAKVFTGDGVVGGKRILSSSAVRKMSVDQTATTLRAGSPSGFRYGLGWDTVADPALKSAGVRGWTKGGDIGQYHAGFVIAPDQGLAVVVEGAGRGFSSGSAETIAHTVALNALVETGAIGELPKQITGKPAKAKAIAKDIRKMTGIFTSQAAVVRVAAGKDRSLKVAFLSDGKWVNQPGRLVRRKGGAFWSTKSSGISLRTVKAWGRTYLVKRSLGGTGTYYVDDALGQRTRSIGSLSSAWQGRVGQKWLLANEDPSSIAWNEAPAVEIADIPGLSGYLSAKGALVESVPFDATTSDTLGTMYLEVPLVNGRDLYDFDFSPVDGDELLSFSSSVLRPAATVPDLVGGSNPVAIASQGLVRWFRVPNASKLTIAGQGDWKLFDPDLSIKDSGGAETATKQAPAGAYLAVFGAAGSSATVTVA